MAQKLSWRTRQIFLLGFSFFICSIALAQTDADGIMMTKNNFCTGVTYTQSGWDHYWEGTHKRDNANLGTVSSRSIGVMGIYGVSDKFNVLFSLPYIKTKASAGQLQGMQGLQDVSLLLKYLPLKVKAGKGFVSLYTVAGVSIPLSDYNPDFLPLSIGLHSQSVSLREIIDYQVGDWFVTGSGTYVARQNIKLFRNSYYTTEMHYTNEVRMPDAMQLMFSCGYRTHRLIAEAMMANWTTLGGFDITKNNMPFPSNRMNMTSAAMNIKYYLKHITGLSFNASGNFVVKGRNAGQSRSIGAGAFYIIDFSGHHSKMLTSNMQQ